MLPGKKSAYAPKMKAPGGLDVCSRKRRCQKIVKILVNDFLALVLKSESVRKFINRLHCPVQAFVFFSASFSLQFICDFHRYNNTSKNNIRKSKASRRWDQWTTRNFVCKIWSSLDDDLKSVKLKTAFKNPLEKTEFAFSKFIERLVPNSSLMALWGRIWEQNKR